MRVENVAVNNISTFAPIDYQEAEGNNFQIGFRGGVVRDSRDSLIRPTTGSHLEFSYEEVTGEHTFPLINLIANKYWTTFQRADGSGRQVLVYHGQAGWAGTTTPVYERFFAGGFTTIRGFQFRGVGPNINGFMVGGDFLLLNSLEYQVPVMANDNVYLVGFVDSGTVSPRINDFETYRVAAGFGVRFVVPMLGPVPIALDFGFPVHKAPGDITQVFNFWMGFSR
jgi:outer membrane protein insertion porin family